MLQSELGSLAWVSAKAGLFDHLRSLPDCSEGKELGECGRRCRACNRHRDGGLLMLTLSGEPQEVSGPVRSIAPRLHRVLDIGGWCSGQ